MDKTSVKIARLISFILHPLLMPAIGLILIFNSGTYLSYIPFEGKRIIFYLILSGTFIIPLCFMPFFFYFKIIDSIEIDSPGHRILPLIITGMLYFSTYFIIRKYPIPFINLFVLASSVCVLLNALITYWWKISSHLIGAGGLTGLVVSMFLRLNADIFVLLVLSIFISGLLGFARLRLNAHTQAQVYGGFVLGFTVICGIMLR